MEKKSWLSLEKLLELLAGIEVKKLKSESSSKQLWHFYSPFIQGVAFLLPAECLSCVLKVTNFQSWVWPYVPSQCCSQGGTVLPGE